MATSGTTGQTIFTLQQLLDHAFLRAKVLPQTVGGEVLDRALEALWLMLTGWASRGAPIWRLQTVYGALVNNNPEVRFYEEGVVEVQKANLVSLTKHTPEMASSDAGGTADNAIDGDMATAYVQTSQGSLTLDFGAEISPEVVGLLPNVSQAWDFEIEASIDGLSWSAMQSETAFNVVFRRWLWYVNNSFLSRDGGYRYVRFRSTGSTQLNLLQVFVGEVKTAIELGVLNKDDYFTLPDKTATGARPTQYWQDVIRSRPVLRVWPVPNVDAMFNNMIEALVHRQIEDVGSDLTLQVDVPDRWTEAVIASLAEQVADLTPDFKGDIARLERKAKEARSEAWGGITAKGPLRIQPNISGYTRG